MAGKSPMQASMPPAQSPAPAVAGSTGLEQQNLVGNAAVQAQMGGVGGGGIAPTLAAAGKEMPPDGPPKKQVESQAQEEAGIHLRESKWSGRNRIELSFDVEGVGAAKIDYIEGLYYAQITDGSPVLVFRGGARALGDALIASVGQRLMLMASTGAVQLTPEQQGKVRARIAYVRGRLDEYYASQVEAVPGGGRRDDWEREVYAGAERKDAAASQKNPAGGRHTAVTGASDTQTTHPENPKGKTPTVEPPVEKPPGKPAAPPKTKEPEAPPAPLPAPVRIQFEQNKASADPKALEGLAQWCNGEHVFEVLAYASAEGTAAHNVGLSQRRAEWVRGVLAGKGATHVRAEGRGEEGLSAVEAIEKGRPAADKQKIRQEWRRADVIVTPRPTPTAPPAPKP